MPALYRIEIINHFALRLHPGPLTLAASHDRLLLGLVLLIVLALLLFYLLSPSLLAGGLPSRTGLAIKLDWLLPLPFHGPIHGFLLIGRCAHCLLLQQGSFLFLVVIITCRLVLENGTIPQIVLC